MVNINFFFRGRDSGYYECNQICEKYAEIKKYGNKSNESIRSL